MSVIIDNIEYPTSHVHTGDPWHIHWGGGPIVRTLSPYRPAANDNKKGRKGRFRGSYPVITWLEKHLPEAATAIRELSPAPASVYYDRGGADDDGAWRGDALDDADTLHRIHPIPDELVAAAADGRAIVPRGKHATRLGPLRVGFPATQEQHHVEGKLHRLGRAVFRVDSAESQEGLLVYWLDRKGRVQFPRVQRIVRKTSTIPLNWRLARYMRKWTTKAPTTVDREMERLYDTECRDRYLRRRGTAMPAQIYGPSGHSRVEIPEEKTALRDWLAEQTAGHPVTQLTTGCAAGTDCFGRMPGKKQGQGVAEIWRDDDHAPDLAPDVLLTIETILARGSLSDVAKAHRVETTRPDRAGKRLVLAAGQAVLAAMAANDNKKSEKIAA